MPFKLQKLGFNNRLKTLGRFGLLSIFSFLSFSAEGFDEDDELQPGVRSLKSEVPALSKASIRAADIRSDGRYLFYTLGGTSWSVLDLQDMVTVGVTVTEESPVLDLRLRSPNILTVMTLNKILEYNVSKVYEPELFEGSNQQYERPSQEDETRVIEGCLADDNRAYYLEEDVNFAGLKNKNFNHVVRVVDIPSSFAASEVNWSDFVNDPGNHAPYFILCAGTENLIFSNEIEDASGDLKPNIQITSLPQPSGTAVSASLRNLFEAGRLVDFDEFSLADFGLSADRNYLVALFNVDDVADEPTAENRSQLMAIRTSNLSVVTSSLGEGGLAVGRFSVGDSQFYAPVLQKHFFFRNSSQNDPDRNEILSFDASVLNTSTINPNNENLIIDRGDASAVAADSFREQSLWFSSEGDHYVYALLRNSGMNLYTNAPLLEFTEEPSGSISSGNPITLKFRSDFPINYEVRVMETPDRQGDAAGINLSEGKQIASGSLDEGEVGVVELSVEQLREADEGNLSLFILGSYSQNIGVSSIARLGHQFFYNPPPDPVSNLRLKFGSQSAHVLFDPPRAGGDLSEYVIYFSYTESDLDTLAASVDEISARVEAGNGIVFQNGRFLVSPVRVAAADFQGRYVIHPIENGREIFVRVQVVDTSGQLSADDPAAVSVTPQPTKLLRSAFGDEPSCSLRPQPFSVGGLISLLVLFMAIVRRPSF